MITLEPGMDVSTWIDCINMTGVNEKAKLIRKMDDSYLNDYYDFIELWQVQYEDGYVSTSYINKRQKVLDN